MGVAAARLRCQEIDVRPKPPTGGGGDGRPIQRKSIVPERTGSDMRILLGRCVAILRPHRPIISSCQIYALN